MSREKRTARICELNDEVRTAGPGALTSARWLLTNGVAALGDDAVGGVVRAVQKFDKFDGDNDPHGEHDFGVFSVGGKRFYWKIDYYDLTLTGGSPDPGDEAATCRILTVMLASEY